MMRRLFKVLGAARSLTWALAALLGRLASNVAEEHAPAGP